MQKEIIESKKTVWLVIFSSLLFAACGYHFRGGGSLPGDVRSISIEMLKNRTSETGLENIVTNDLIYEFTRNGRVKVVDKGSSDATLSGIIRTLKIETIAHRGQHTSNERRVTITVDLQLIAQTGELLWEVKGFSEKEEYSVLAGKLGTEQNRRTAIRELSRRFSEKVYDNLTDDF